MARDMVRDPVLMEVATPMRATATSEQYVVQMNELEYWTSQGFGFNVSTGSVALTGNGLQNLAAFTNPSASGVDAFIMMGEFGASQNAIFQRYGAPTITAATSPIAPRNRNGSATTSGCVMYAGGTYTRGGDAADVRKTAHIGAFNQYITNVHRIRLRPGASLAWVLTAVGGIGGGYTGSVFLEWFERPAVT